MTTFLVCRECGNFEPISQNTKFDPCLGCGAPRYAETEAGEHVVVWSANADPLNFDLPVYATKPVE